MYRLTFDVPYTFATRPAYERAQHGTDLRIESATNIYHNAAYGLTMLRPSSLDERWVQNTVPISQLDYQTGHWAKAYRGAAGAGVSRPRAEHLARILDPNPNLIELLINIAIIAVSAQMKWVARTQFDLQPDESFALHFTGADDEAAKESDLLYLQWGRYGLRLDTQGMLEFYLYNPTDLTLPPRLIDRWESGIQSPVRAYSSLVVIPVAPLGILILTVGGATPLINSSSTTRALLSSKLVPLREHAIQVGSNPPTYRMYNATRLHIGVNTALYPILAVERVRYPESGVVVDSPHDLPPIHPQVPQHQAIVVPCTAQSVTTQPLIESGGSWVAWSTPQAPTRYKMRVTLQSASGGVYTPVIGGHYLHCDPLYTTRSTTPQVVARPTRIELTIDEYAREEGYATHWIRANAEPSLLAIAQRGDTTYKLEYSADGGTSWQTLSGGFARIEALELKEPAGVYEARWRLMGLWGRFAELYQLADTAFDGIRLADAFNKILIAAGYEPIAEAGLPNALKAIRLPSASTGDTSVGWKYAPRVGQTGDEILTSLLLYALATGQEWRLRYDYGANKWVLEPKPDGEPSIRLTRKVKNLTARTVRYNRLIFEPQPPEANLIIVEGATVPGREGERLVVQMLNEPSLSNPSSPDYLGRVVSVYLQAEGMSEIDRLQSIAEYLYDAVAKHATRIQLSLPLHHEFESLYLDLLRHLPRKVVVERDGAPDLTAYIKRATLTVEIDTKTTASLTVEGSTAYRSDPRE